MNYLSVQTTMFSAFGYDMSYLEFVGTLFNLACVWLVAKKNIWTWPIGIVGTILFVVLFYQIRLYSDMLLNVWFTLTGIFGWWVWKTGENKNDFTYKWGTWLGNFSGLLIVISGSLLLGNMTQNFHVFMPSLFPEPAAYPYLDAFITMLSFGATISMIFKRIESWIIWMIIDVISIGMYFAKGVIFVSLLYAIFFFICIKGLIEWRNHYNRTARVVGYTI